MLINTFPLSKNPIDNLYYALNLTFLCAATSTCLLPYWAVRPTPTRRPSPRPRPPGCCPSRLLTAARTRACDQERTYLSITRRHNFIHKYSNFCLSGAWISLSPASYSGHLCSIIFYTRVLVLFSALSPWTRQMRLSNEAQIGTPASWSIQMHLFSSTFSYISRLLSIVI